MEVCKGKTVEECSADAADREECSTGAAEREGAGEKGDGVGEERDRVWGEV